MAETKGDTVEWLASDSVRALLIPAVVATAVTLMFEVVFKPSIAVRTERRLAHDRARRDAVAALLALASRAHVVSLTGGPLLRVLTEEVEQMFSEIREVRDAAVRGPEWGHQSSRVVTASLALIQAQGVMLDETAKGLISAPDVASVTAPARDYLQLAADGLLAVAAMLQVRRWQVLKAYRARRALAHALQDQELLRERLDEDP